MSQLDDLLGGLVGGKGGGALGAMAGGKSGGLMGALVPVTGGMLAGGGLRKLLSGFQANGLGSRGEALPSRTIRGLLCPPRSPSAD